MSAHVVEIQAVAIQDSNKTVELDSFDRYLDELERDLETVMIELGEFHYRPLIQDNSKNDSSSDQPV